MKVIHLISGGDSGGAKTHVHSLLENLGKTIDVTMVCFMDGPFVQEAIALGIRTIILPHRNPLHALKKLEALVHEEKYDLIHCHGARGNMMGVLLGHRVSLPVVSTVHSDYRLDYLGRPISRLTYGTINTLALRKINYHIGVSDAMVDLLIRRGFNPDNLFAIYNGLDFTPVPPAMTRAQFHQSVGLQADEDSVVVGIAARLNPVKDIGTLIRGFAKAHQQCPQLRLLIAGDGEDQKALEQLSENLGVTQQVCFAGWVGDINSFYHALDVNTLTSLSETFPYALTEGAKVALPTISSRVGGVPYLIDHGANGLLFQPGDSDTLAQHLVSLASSKELRQKLGKRLYEKAKTQYSLARTIQRQLEIYNTILRRQKRKQSGRDGILVCGAYGRGNAGDDAILESILTELRGLDPDMPLWVLSRSPKDTRLTYRVNAIYTFDFLKFLRTMRRTQLYINGGGSLMQDITSHRSLWFYLFTIWAAKERHNKVIMYGCGIGPISSPNNRKRTGRILQNNVDTITLRDTHSKEELADMGVTNPKIILSADPTVILNGAPADVVDGLMTSNGLDFNGKYIGFTLRLWPGFDSKIKVLAAAADYAYQHYGLTPVFLPIEPRLDVAAAQRVAEHMTAPHHILHDTGSSAHTIGLFSRMSVVISMRLHGLVFSARQGVPLVGIVYDQKVSSFLQYIGQDLFVDLDALTVDGLTSQIDRAVSRIDETERLAAGTARLCQVEQRNTQAVQALLELH